MYFKEEIMAGIPGKGCFYPPMLFGSNFCGNSIKDFLARLGIPYDSVKSLDQLKKIVKRNIF
ncbi:MAG: hypothetical protein ACFWTJ_15325 [Lachnoclostridium sp.]|jgi:glutaredoxin-related protein